MWVHWGSEQQEELRYQVSYHTYVAYKGDCYIYIMTVTYSWLNNT